MVLVKQVAACFTPMGNGVGTQMGNGGGVGTHASGGKLHFCVFVFG